MVGFRLVVATAGCLSFIAGSAAIGGDTIRIADIEPLSGPPAAVGKWWSNHVQFAVDQVNARGGVLGGQRIEVVQFDSKASPAEALIALKAVTDQGIHFVFGTAGSHVAIALTEAIAKHNARNPDARVLFLNYGGLAPELTNEQCNFWHFRFDANADMKVVGLVQQMAASRNVRKVYLLNQDYAYGQAVRKLLRELIAQRRPDVEVVGDDLIQLQKTKDFAPYVAKIKASGADTVITSNWGPDLVLLVRASHDSGLSARYYTLNAHFIGTPTAIAEAGAERLINVNPWHSNVADGRLTSYFLDYRNKYKEEWNALPQKIAVEMWAKAVDATKSTDPVKIATALETMRYDAGTGMMWMRADDHQIMQAQYAAVFTKAGQGVKYDVEGTGFGWKTEGRIEAEDAVLPHRCKMERPR
jgi:branched-chain amino acid transport system substrate-binding protein